jgi:transketolase
MTTTAVTSGTGLDVVAELAAQLRVDSVRSSTSAGSGHPTSSMSAADLLAVLVTRHLRYDWDDPRSPANDHLIFSKGHASPLLYSVFKAVGVVSEQELMTGYRRFGQRLQGHPTPVLPWVDVATGSLGQGLPDGVGVALAGKCLDGLPYRVWVLCGDGELARARSGRRWTRPLTTSSPTWSSSSTSTGLAKAARPTWAGTWMPTPAVPGAFGARTLVIDGHDLAAIDDALATAGQAAGEQPTVILAKTNKGRGFSEVEDRQGWHGRPFPPGHGRTGDCRARRRAEPGAPRPAPAAGSRQPPAGRASKHRRGAAWLR